MPTAKRLLTALNVNNIIYVFGGYSGATRLSQDVVEFYNGQKWATFSTPLLTARVFSLTKNIF